MKPFVLKGHERPVNIIKFNYDGDLFFSGSAESKINLWESFTGERIGSYKTKSAVKSLDVDINSQHLVCCGFDGTLEVFFNLFRFFKYKRANPKDSYDSH